MTNTMPAETESVLSVRQYSLRKYAAVFAVIEIAAFYFYVNYVSCFNIYSSMKKGLAVLAVTAGGAELLLTWKKDRTITGMLTGTLLPFLIFETELFYAYFEDIHVLLFAGFGIDALISAVFAYRKLHARKKQTGRGKYFRRCFFQAFHKLAFGVFLMFCVYGRYAIQTRMTVSYVESTVMNTDDSDSIDFENMLSVNLSTIAKLDSSQNWKSLSVEEVTEVLETVMRVSCSSLGMKDSFPSLEIAYLEDGLLGQYDHETDTITLSYNYIIDTRVNGYSAVQVLCHEIYHRYQHYEVELLEAVKNNEDYEKYSDLQILSDATVYQEELNNYVYPDGSSLSYYRYKSQQVELDAERYGDAAMDEYYNEVQDYLRYMN